MKNKIVTRALPCHLTQEELDVFRDEIANCIHSREEVEQKKSEASKKFTDTIKLIDGRIEYISERIRSRSQNKSVECHWEYNPLSKKMELYRDDTNEKLESRELTEDEMQMEASFCDQFDNQEKTSIIG